MRPGGAGAGRHADAAGDRSTRSTRWQRDGWAPEIVVLLQPTSPLRRPEHIRDAVALLRETDADSVVTVVEVPRHLSPDYVMRIEDGVLRPFLPEGARVTRRQDARPAYSRDGTVYAFWRDTLERFGNIYGDDCRPLLVDAADRCRSTRRPTGPRPRAILAAERGVGGERERACAQLVPRCRAGTASARSWRAVQARAGSSAISPRWPRARDTIVAGPWLGEVGFELLYWVPFLRWFAERFHVAPERLLVVSRGGTASWYRPFAGRLPRDLRLPHARGVPPPPRRARRGQRRAEADAGARLRARAAARAAPTDVAHRVDAAPVDDVRAVQPVLVGARRTSVGARARRATRRLRAAACRRHARCPRRRTRR